MLHCFFWGFLLLYPPFILGTEPFTKVFDVTFLTPSTRPFNLVLMLDAIMQFRDSNDLSVLWVVVHSSKTTACPRFFVNLFPFVVELCAGTPPTASRSGNHERNVGLEFISQYVPPSGHLYFLDDDNLPPKTLTSSKIRLDDRIFYYFNQSECNKSRLKLPTTLYSLSRKDSSLAPSLIINGTDKRSFSCFRMNDHDLYLFNKTECNRATLQVSKSLYWFSRKERSLVSQLTINHMDTGSFLVPLSFVQGEKWAETPTELTRYNQDGYFWTRIIEKRVENSLISMQNSSDLQPTHNEISCKKLFGPRHKYSSLKVFQDMVISMTEAWADIDHSKRMKRAEISFHEYVHILYDLRQITKVRDAVYVEIGIWKGASSLMMHAHPQATEVIGIDPFMFPKQESEAYALKEALFSSEESNITWIKGFSQDIGIRGTLQRLLHSRCIDILFIDGDHSKGKAPRDFELYESLVCRGGFIVFDDFLDHHFSPSVKKDLLSLMDRGVFRKLGYKIWGTLPNVARARVIWRDDPFQFGDSASNEFVVQKQH